MIAITPEASLEKAATEYRQDRTNPEAVFNLSEAFWNNFGANLQRSGMSLSKHDLRTLGFTSEELRELYYQRARSSDIAKEDLAVGSLLVIRETLSDHLKQEIPDVPLFLPEVLANQFGLRLLGKGFPELKSWIFETREDIINNCVLSGKPEISGWMFIESSLTPPYNNMSWAEAETIFQAKGRLEQTASIYVAGSALSKAIEGHYFDEGSYEKSRILGSAIWGTWQIEEDITGYGSYYHTGFGIGCVDKAHLVTDWFKESAKSPSIGFRSAEPILKIA